MKNVVPQTAGGELWKISITWAASHAEAGHPRKSLTRPESPRSQYWGKSKLTHDAVKAIIPASSADDFRFRRGENPAVEKFMPRLKPRIKSGWGAAVFFLMLAAEFSSLSQQEAIAPLPKGVQAVWDVGTAFHETTSTRERICLNGLWQWQPAQAQTETIPAGGWGFFKVPGNWPGITDYLQKDSQTVFPHADWATRDYAKLNAAWYQRQITIRGEWRGRRISVNIEYLNSLAAVFVDGRKAGEIRFPGGDLDLSSVCRPGSTHQLSVLVIALPLKGILLSYTDSASAREVKGSVPRRGLCGDVYLVSQPIGPRIAASKLDTSVRRGEVTFRATLENLVGNQLYRIRSRVITGGRTVKEFNSPPFPGTDLKEGRMEFTEKWIPEKLWDTHTPQNMYELETALLDASGKEMDVHWITRFGFREFWIEGRDFFLNGTRLHLSAVPLDNAQIGAALSTYPAARETLERLKSFGINFVYTHNYDCEPGAHLSFGEILRAADDVGMLVSLTQPHFSHYEWKEPDADSNNGYARHAAFYAQVAQDHPSVVMYAMSHNATGYAEDMNPDLIDGLHDPRDAWATRNVKMAQRAEAIVQRLDPVRVVYHHASGNLGSMHAINFYPNFVPVQELSDWFEHWAGEGVKPAFLCEYGAPFTWDWTMYRGWYKGQREFGSARVPWEFCLAEWNAQFFGDRAYAISEPEKANLRWEAKQFRAGNVWHRWDYPNQVGSERFEERYPVFALYLTDNWRAFRTWGVSAISPWEFGHFWKLRAGVDKNREEFKTDWNNIQRPGFSPDYIDNRYERMDIAFRRSDWKATPAAEALLRNNRPLLAYIGGGPDHFTSKDHDFFPDDVVEKQLIVLNDSREPIKCDAQWTFQGASVDAVIEKIIVAAGGQTRLPIRLKLPTTIAPGRYELKAGFKFSNGESQEDHFSVDVLPRPHAAEVKGRIALFDPKGETGALLKRLGVRSESVPVDADLAPFDLLIVGKAALTVEGLAPDISRVRQGLKVIIFEQTADVLQNRFGFRVEEYGLRQVFPRVHEHPALAQLTADNLRDWRGEATLLPALLNYEMRPRYGPTVLWSGIPVTRLWRCGNRGNVASVLIEKPARGDFLSLLDGGFGEQYSVLLEHHEGKGMVLFWQADVTGRTQSDPTAEILVGNILRHTLAWKPIPKRNAVYAGDPAGQKYLESSGVSARWYDGGKLAADDVLVAGPSAGRSVNQDKSDVSEWLNAGGNLLALGLDQADADQLLPFKVEIKPAEHISAWFEPEKPNSLLAGIAPADVHNRDPRIIPLVRAGARILGDGVLAQADNGHVVFFQMAPWQFEPASQSNLRRTQRRASTALSRLLANMGVECPVPVLDRFHRPVDTKNAPPEQRWLAGFYMDTPEEWDDPYRFFRW